MNTMNTESKEMAVMADMAKVDLIENLKHPDSNLFCSLQDDGTRKSKIAIYNAINNADERLSEHIGETLEIIDVVLPAIGNTKLFLFTITVVKSSE